MMIDSWNDPNRPNPWADETLLDESWILSEAGANSRNEERHYRALKARHSGSNYVGYQGKLQSARDYAVKKNALILAIQNASTPLQRAAIWHWNQLPTLGSQTAPDWLQRKEGIILRDLSEDELHRLKEDIAPILNTKPEYAIIDQKRHQDKSLEVSD